MSSVGNTFRVFANFYSTDPTTGKQTPTDPSGTITIRYSDPSGTVATADYPGTNWTKLVVGRYYYDINPSDTQVGIWSGRVYTTVGGVKKISQDFSFEATATALPT